MKKLFYSAAAIAVVLIVGMIVGYKLHAPSIQVSTTPAGGTTSTAHFYSIAVNLASPGANATSSSILNTSSNDMYVSSVKIGCEAVGTSKTAYTGTGLAALQFSVGTSSTAAPVVVPGNLVGGNAITVSTSTAYFGISSSTIVVPGSTSVNIIWQAGSYMTFWANATNTATCTAGVEAFSS